jgi:hypothetical protein
MAKSKTSKKAPGKKISEYERLMALSDAEKDADVAEFENGVDRPQFRPLNAAELKKWARIKRRIGRPVVGKGSKMVAVSMERGLLKEVDKYAKAHDMKRAEMIAQGLRLILGRKAG